MESIQLIRKDSPSSRVAASAKTTDQARAVLDEWDQESDSMPSTGKKGGARAAKKPAKSGKTKSRKH